MKYQTLGSMKRQKGATLLEITMVIGIIALISIAAIVAYNSANESKRITKATQELGSMVGGIRNLFGAQGNYVDLGNDVVIAAGFMPEEMVNAAANEIHHPWLDAGVTVVEDPANNRQFIVTYADVPQEACIAMASSTLRNAVTIDVGASVNVAGVGAITTGCNGGADIVWTFE